MKRSERTTTVSISEKINTNYKTHPALIRRERIIIHDGWEWHMGTVHNEDQLKELLDYLEIKITGVEREAEYEETGKITTYNLSKNIVTNCMGGFWSMEQLKEMSNNKELKKVKGLSNGSVVDCYVSIEDNKVTVYRPNPNAKEVYNTMNLEDELEFRRNNWYL